MDTLRVQVSVMTYGHGGSCTGSSLVARESSAGAEVRSPATPERLPEWTVRYALDEDVAWSRTFASYAVSLGSLPLASTSSPAPAGPTRAARPPTS